MVLKDGKDGYCEECDKKYTDINHKWCKSCQTNYLKRNFVNWKSGNKEIDQFIQDMQLNIDSYNDLIFEWIQYDQFSFIKEISRDDYITIYSATWKNHSLYYDEDKNKYMRIDQNKKVILQYFHYPEITASEFLNEVYNFSFYLIHTLFLITIFII
jgi:hypothetical protein